MVMPWLLFSVTNIATTTIIVIIIMTSNVINMAIGQLYLFVQALGCVNLLQLGRVSTFGFFWCFKVAVESELGFCPVLCVLA